MSVFRHAMAALLLAASSHAAIASETVSYKYDARGRLVWVQHAGTVNNGVTADYSLDKAENRNSKTISNQTGVVSFEIYDAAAVEGGYLRFTVVKNGIAVTSHSVNYATANGTAVSGTDFAPTSGTLTFAVNEASKTVDVPTINDGTHENAENFYLNLSGATGGATINDNQAIGTITDNDQSGPAGGNDCYTDQTGQIICQ